jgi:3'-5' exoribonuclease
MRFVAFVPHGKTSMPDPHVDISSLTSDVEVVSFYLCKSIEQKTTKTNQPYVQATLTDRTGSIDARVWGKGLDAFPGVEAGIVVKVHGVTETYQDKLQLKVLRLRGATEADGVDKRDLMRMSPMDPEWYLAEIMREISAHCQTSISTVLCGCLTEHAAMFTASPAAMQLHHPYIGGLAEHTYSLVRAAIWCAGRYDLDITVMIGIAVMHDIGKVVELDESGYTEAGRMFGHISIGAEIWRDAWARADEQDPILFGEILHGILSHHGSLEHGSPVVPCTKEAIAFHHLDMLDSRMGMFDEAMMADSGPGTFTGYHRQFGGALKKPERTTE